MFIPNKTYQAIKVGVLGVISALLLIIAAEMVLYVTLSQKQNEKFQQLSIKIDSLGNISDKSTKHFTDKDSDRNKQILYLTRQLESLQKKAKVTKNTVDNLVKHQCTIGSYDTDKRLPEICSQ